MCFFKCIFNVPIRVKPASQYGHLKGFAFPCTRREWPDISPLTKSTIHDCRSKKRTHRELKRSLQIEHEKIFGFSVLVFELTSTRAEMLSPFGLASSGIFIIPFIFASILAFFGDCGDEPPSTLPLEVNAPVSSARAFSLACTFLT